MPDCEVLTVVLTSRTGILRVFFGPAGGLPTLIWRRFRRLRRAIGNLRPFHSPGPDDVRMTSFIHAVLLSQRIVYTRQRATCSTEAHQRDLEPTAYAAHRRRWTLNHGFAICVLLVDKSTLVSEPGRAFETYLRIHPVATGAGHPLAGRAVGWIAARDRQRRAAGRCAADSLVSHDGGCCVAVLDRGSRTSRRSLPAGRAARRFIHSRQSGRCGPTPSRW